MGEYGQELFYQNKQKVLRATLFLSHLTSFCSFMISRLSADRQLPAFPGDPGWGGLSSQPSQIVKYEELGANNLHRLKGTNISSHMPLTSFSLQPRLTLVSR